MDGRYLQISHDAVPAGVEQSLIGRVMHAVADGKSVRDRGDEKGLIVTVRFLLHLFEGSVPFLLYAFLIRRSELAAAVIIPFRTDHRIKQHCQPGKEQDQNPHSSPAHSFLYLFFFHILLLPFSALLRDQ